MTNPKPRLRETLNEASHSAQRAKLLDNGRRQAAVKGTPDELDFEPVVKLIALRLVHVQLSRLGNNLNQMVRHLHQTGDPLPADLEPLLKDIRQILARGVPR